MIALPYDPKNWNTRNVMRILGKVSLLEMNDITWQLGAGEYKNLNENPYFFFFAQKIFALNNNC